VIAPPGSNSQKLVHCAYAVFLPQPLVTNFDLFRRLPRCQGCDGRALQPKVFLEAELGQAIDKMRGSASRHQDVIRTASQAFVIKHH